MEPDRGSPSQGQAPGREDMTTPESAPRYLYLFEDGTMRQSRELGAGDKQAIEDGVLDVLQWSDEHGYMLFEQDGKSWRVDIVESSGFTAEEED